MSDTVQPSREDLLKAFEPWLKVDAEMNHDLPYRLMTWIEFTDHADALVELCKSLMVRKIVIKQGDVVLVDILLNYEPGKILPVAPMTPERFISLLRKCTDDAKEKKLKLIPLGLMPETNVEQVKRIMNGEDIFEWTFALGFNQELFVPEPPPVPADEG